jgi:protein SCO1/2
MAIKENFSCKKFCRNYCLLITVYCLLFAVYYFLPSPALAQAPQPDKIIEGVRFEQKLNQQLPLEVTFKDETGQTVHLGDYFGDKPVILVLAYYECPMLCTLVLNGLLASLEELTFDVGNQFDIVTVSFDPGETPELAAAKKEAYIRMYGRPGAAEGWHFLTGDEASIKKLTEAVGFYYNYDSTRDEYAHPTGIMVVTPQGKLARYLYGIDFPPTDLRLGLVEAAENRIGSPVDQILLMCYHYDPVVGKYTVTIMTFVRLAGLVTVGAIGAVIATFLWRDHNRKLTSSA